jgi:hypothetical protein
VASNEETPSGQETGRPILLAWAAPVFAAGVDQAVRENWLTAVVAIALAAGMAFVAVRPRVLPVGMAASLAGISRDVRWWLAPIGIASLAVIFSPFVEQRRIPFAWILESNRQLDRAPPDVRSRLGASLDPPQQASLVELNFFDQGTAIWIKELTGFIRLKKDFTWDRRPHNHEFSPTLDPDYWNVDKQRAALSMPPTQMPPIGGLAAEWKTEPSQWSWLGNRQWTCPITTGGVSIQHFEHGMVLGPLPMERGSPDVQAIAVFYDGMTWTSWPGAGLVPTCNPSP